MLNRRALLAQAGAMAAGGSWSLAAQSQALESARLLVGFVPGGLSDQIARQLAEKLRGSYAPAVIVDNKPGASGQLALAAAKDGAADGSVMILSHSSALAMYPFTFRKLPYDPLKDFQPAALVCYTNHALAVGPAVPASVRNMREFIAWTQANPQQANYGAPGVGSMPHLIVTVVNQQSKSDLRLVAYKGTAGAITDLLGGQISAASGPLGNFLPQVKAGKLRLLATSGDTRSQHAADVATYREQGFELTAREWYAVYLPTRAGKEVARRAATAVEAALRDPALAAALTQAGVDVASGGPAEVARMLDLDTKEWQRLTRQIGFTAES